MHTFSLHMSLMPLYEPHSCDSGLVFRAKQVQGSQKLPLCTEYVTSNIHLGVSWLICSSSSQFHLTGNRFHVAVRSSSFVTSPFSLQGFKTRLPHCLQNSTSFFSRCRHISSLINCKFLCQRGFALV